MSHNIPTVKRQSSRSIFARGKQANTSVLDTKETLEHFYNVPKGSNHAKNSFVTVSYRYKNLDLSGWLSRTSFFVPDSQTEKTIKRLRWCSAASIIKQTKDDVKIERSSKTCKSAHCAICARQKSAKISSRLIDAIRDPKHKDIFKDRYFYFLTLTVKHDEETRTGIYMSDFKKEVKKLYRSKFWKTHFPFTKKEPESGWITSYETTISNMKTGYHIHSHILICGPRMKMRAMDFQKEVRNKWQKITSDSFQVKFDLVKLRGLKAEIQESEGSGDIQENAVHETVRELIKYGTKAGNFKEWNDEKAEMYGAWVEGTKGANFLNCSGFFRGMGITGNKSDYDLKADEMKERDPVDESGESQYFFGPTANIKFNHSTKWRKPEHRKKAMETVHIEKIEDFYNVTPIAPEAFEFIALRKNDDDWREWLETTMPFYSRNLPGSVVKKMKEKEKEEIKGLIGEFDKIRNTQIDIFQNYDFSDDIDDTNLSVYSSEL